MTVGDNKNSMMILGRQRLLAPHWPVHLGGLGTSQEVAASVLEELCLHGIDETRRILTIDVVGNCILVAGSEAQKEAWLPAFARGEAFSAVLLSESTAGSDLAAIKTTATNNPAGWHVHGTKTWSQTSLAADYGLCLAKTGSGSPTTSFTLFLLDLRQPGTLLRELTTIGREAFVEVQIDAIVPDEHRIGRRGAGWTLILEALRHERTGREQNAKAARWLAQLLASRPEAAESEVVLSLLSRLAIGKQLSLQLSRELGAARRTEQFLSETELDAASAACKHFNTKLAQDVLFESLRLLGVGALTPYDQMKSGEVLAGGVQWLELPGLGISAGTTEIMLNTVARSVVKND